MYRIGFPFWREAARFGVPLKLRINVTRDDEAGVLVASSDDLRGLVCEAATFDELVREVTSATQELLTLQLHREPVSKTVTDLRLCPA